MKAFIYNFERYVKSLLKIDYILSNKAARERNVALKFYIDTWKVNIN